MNVYLPMAPALPLQKNRTSACPADSSWILYAILGALEQDDFPSNHHPALSFCWSMIFSENRHPLFGIMF
jgi:hypothetical protein